jgi:cyclopropane-fatty-acyl-phospholipid synthase
LLDIADIRLDGDRPWDLRLLEPGVLERVFAHGNLGLGESYMDGHWEVDQLDVFFERVLRARLDQKIHPLRLAFHALRVRLLNRQSRRRAWQVGRAHYDLGNDFYAAMLDARMTYTCGYWSGGAHTLAEAQAAKLDLICRKLKLQPGMRVLDIGCGWGSFMAYAAEHYGVECVGVTISREQIAWHANFEAAWPRFRDALGERFQRMWRYYLLSCAGAFRARDLQLGQWVLSKPGVAGVYERLSQHGCH